MVIPERNMFLKWLGDIWKISKYLCENDMNTSNYSNKSILSEYFDKVIIGTVMKNISIS
jgi:hypothetical protein